MYVIRTDSTEPAFNLAFEQYCLERIPGEIVAVWRNDRSVIIGKNQNAYAEIDGEFVRKNGIEVIRRLTGGGAVFHDLGNINFTMITDELDHFGDYSFFTAPIRAFLSRNHDVDPDAQALRAKRQLYYVI